MASLKTLHIGQLCYVDAINVLASSSLATSSSSDSDPGSSFWLLRDPDTVCLSCNYFTFCSFWSVIWGLVARISLPLGVPGSPVLLRIPDCSPPVLHEVIHLYSLQAKADSTWALHPSCCPQKCSLTNMLRPSKAALHWDWARRHKGVHSLAALPEHPSGMGRARWLIRFLCPFDGAGCKNSQKFWLPQLGHCFLGLAAGPLPVPLPRCPLPTPGPRGP